MFYKLQNSEDQLHSVNTQHLKSILLVPENTEVFPSILFLPFVGLSSGHLAHGRSRSGASSVLRKELILILRKEPQALLAEVRLHCSYATKSFSVSYRTRYLRGLNSDLPL